MNQDYQDPRLQYTLHKGDTILAGDHLYTIAGTPIGFGGSSILYPASRSGSELLYAIKECFPSTPVNSFARINGIIRPKSLEDVEAAGALMHFRDRMEIERIIGQRISNTNARAIGIWEIQEPSAITTNGQEYTDVSDGIFAVLERMDTKGMTFRQLLEDISQAVSKDHPLRTGSLPKIYTTACMMEQVLLALQRVHKAGYIFGDIQDGNVFFSDCHPENGDIGIGNLLDFGCARELINGEHTDPITDACFTTRGFIPPELLDPNKNDGSLTLGPEADIYSVGCLMLRCLVSKYKIRAMGDSPAIGSNTIDGQEARKLGCSESVRKNLNSILRQAMAREPEDRYPSAEAMLEDIRNLKRDTRPPEYLLPPAPGASESFVEHSRDREIKELSCALEENEPVFIWGLGGIGKSEIAIQIARRWDSPKGAYFIHYTLPSNEEQEAMEETILRMPLSGYRYAPSAKGLTLDQIRREEYQERLDILREQYSGALIIIDNFDRPGYTLAQLMQERSYGEVVSLGVKLLFTTRNTVDWAPEWEVGSLQREDLLVLMRRWCKNRKITDEVLLELIDVVDGHTLTVDLMAKTLEESWGEITPEMILKALRNSSLSKGDYPDVDHNAIRRGQVSKAARHRELRTGRVYEHLKVLFDLTGMTEEAKTVLCCATLLPTGGMDALMFRSCLKEEEQKALQSLVKRGWLSRTEDLLKIHPITREVCREELKPTSKGCLEFLNNLWEKYDYNKPYQSKLYMQLAKVFVNTTGLSDCEATLYWYHATLIYSKIYWSLNAIDCAQRCIDAFATLSTKYTLGTYLSEIYRIYGENLCIIGLFEEAYLKFWIALNLIKKYCPSDHSAEAHVYRGIGKLYFSRKNWKASLENYQMALASFQKEGSSEAANIGLVYLDMASACDSLGDLVSALEYRNRANKILADQSQNEEIIHAEVIKNQGNALMKCNKFAEALEKFHEAMDLYTPLYPNDHAQIAYVHYALGGCYLGLKQPQNALSELNMAQEINTKIYGKNSKPVADTLVYVANAHAQAKDYAEAISSQQQAVTIFEQLSLTDVQMSKAYLNLAQYYDFHSNHTHSANEAEYAKNETAKWYMKSANLGNAEAMNGLGYAYLIGSGVPQDLQIAFSWFLKSAENGCSSGMNNTAISYADGEGVPEDQDQAFYWYEKAANAGHVSAMVSLGHSYQYGKGVPVDYKKAFFWYKQSAEGQDAHGFNYLGLAYQDGIGCDKDDIEAFKCFKMAAEKGNVSGMYNLGRAYAYGHGISENQHNALFWLKKASTAGSKGAPAIIGEIYENQSAYADALYWYQIGSARGNARALLSLGYLYWCGNGVEQNRQMAFSFFERAAQKGNNTAMYNVAFAYEKGIGVACDKEKAFMWYQCAAEAGNKSAKLELASMYITQANSDRLNGDDEKQLELYHKAEKIYTEILPSNDKKLLGIYMDIGRKYQRTRNFSKALHYYQVLASHGDPFFMMMVGSFKIDGYGCQQNYKEAFQLLEQSYLQGEKKAALDLGYLYLKGYGCEKDILHAKTLFEGLAHTDIPNKVACEYLGDLYFSKDPEITNLIPPSPTKALEYYKMASSPRNSEVQEKIKQIEKLLS